MRQRLWQWFVLILICAPTASAQPLESLRAATDPASASRWQAVAVTHPEAVVLAIASAERRGWKPTSTTMYAAKGQPASFLIRPAQFYASSWSGEMLVWDWDDGNPNTAEGTVWVRSYYTGNEVMFNVQFAGDTYDSVEISYYEGVYGEMRASLSGVDLRTPLFSPRVIPAQLHDSRNYCTTQGQRAGASCIVRNMGRYARAGLRGVAADFGVAGIRGALTGGLAAALRGAVAPGVLAGSFAAGVLEELIWGAENWECRNEAQRAYYECINEWSECSRTRAGCPYGTGGWRGFE